MPTAVYWRYHAQYEEEFDTFDEAVGFLNTGREYGEMAPEKITSKERVIEEDELYDLMNDYGTDDYKSQDWIEGEVVEEEDVTPGLMNPPLIPERTSGPGWPD